LRAAAAALRPHAADHVDDVLLGLVAVAGAQSLLEDARQLAAQLLAGRLDDGYAERLAAAAGPPARR